jgi:glycosyltransferase involved in cell wall biosynthesis
MKPKLSIIIPHRNQHHLLPRLFESIARQSLRPLEVILVDDCSDTPCDAIAERYSSGDLSVRVISMNTRTPVWIRRILGARAAQSDVLAFADSDDALWGNDVLEYHVNMLREAQADMIHFRSVLVDEELKFTAFCTYHDPFSTELHGKEIFRTYAEKGFAGDPLWTKIFARQLWLDIADITTGGNVGNLHEDAYLTTLLMFHADHYIGSERVAYAHVPSAKIELNPQRMLDNYHILAEFVPYLRNHGCPEDILSKCINRYKKRICV